MELKRETICEETFYILQEYYHLNTEPLFSVGKNRNRFSVFLVNIEEKKGTPPSLLIFSIKESRNLL